MTRSAAFADEVSADREPLLEDHKVPVTHVELFDGSAAEWDAFVQCQPHWTHFHLYGWRTVIEKVFGHECLFLAARTNGSLSGILPLVRVRSSLFGRYLVSMPFVNYGGPLGTDQAVRALAADATNRAVREGELLQLRSGWALPTDLPVSHHKITVLTDLPPGGADGIWKQLSHKMRTKIRKPQKEGVTFRFGETEIAPFFRIFAHNMRDLGTPTQSELLFRVIAEVFGDSVWFGCAYFNGVAIAGGCGFFWKREFEITWSSSLRDSQHLRAGYLLHWSFMERAANEGAEVYNFGRSTPGSGTHEFKQQWGGRDEPLWWYYSTNGKGTSTPAPQDSKFAWGPRLWKRLPVAIATQLGPHIVRNIP